MNSIQTREGILYGLIAYGWWGLVPLYFYWLGDISPFEALAHRIAWSAVLLAIVLTFTRRWSEFARCLSNRSLALPLLLSACFLGYNWMLFNVCVSIGDVIQASLGYFILPLFSALLAVVIFGERLRPLQHLAVIFAFAGTAFLTWDGGAFPALAVALALSFSIYGVLRKKIAVDGVMGLAIESFMLAPIAVAFLAVLHWQRQETPTPEEWFKLSLGGVVTAFPLMCFGQAARRLPLAMLGFMQYISPSMQFLLAVVLLNEKVRGGWLNYGLIWTALAIFSLDSYLWIRRQVPAV
jgi:chloramphenicol-sensitive protein RarD